MGSSNALILPSPAPPEPVLVDGTEFDPEYRPAMYECHCGSQNGEKIPQGPNTWYWRCSSCGLVTLFRHYVPGGPTLKAFHEDDSYCRVVLGPIGSGKSVSCVWEILLRAMRQRPDALGRRRSRWAIIRQTYGQLKSTTIKTWLQWVNAPVVYDSPIRSQVYIDLDDGTVVDLEVLFFSMDKPKSVSDALSMEVTGVWINEARDVPKKSIDAIMDRTGRYPSKEEGGSTWHGTIMDSNMADDDHWLHDLCVNVKPWNWKFYLQPGALIKMIDRVGNVTYIENPCAENVHNHQGGYWYWFEKLPGKDQDYIQVFILADWGSIFTGRPVYGNWFRESIHVSKVPLEIHWGRPLFTCWDFGLTPACIAFQVSPLGQVRALREFCTQDEGVKQHASLRVKPALALEFGNRLPLRSWGDPAGSARAQADSELDCISMLNKLGFNCEPAATNDFIIRRQAVIDALCRMVGGEPGILIDPQCVMLIRGFAGGYQFERVASASGTERYRDVPAKNRFSHPHEALQYGIMGAMGPGGTVAGATSGVVLLAQGNTWAGAV
jgi:hypothetical protein